ncbi:MAG: cyclic nucleotide-binding/CBS domain-containing protein [Planctomycetota bacterium]
MTLLKELITRLPKFVSVAPTDSVRTAAKVMTDTNRNAVVIIDGQDMVGIVTERDLVRRVLLGGRDVDQVTAAEIMTEDLVVARQDSSVGAAIVLMRRHHIQHVPVVGHHGTLLAVLALRDLISEEVHEMRDYLALGDG